MVLCKERRQELLREWASTLYVNIDHMTMREIENIVIRAKLELVDGNEAQAARELGISRRTIQRRMKEQQCGQ